MWVGFVVYECVTRMVNRNVCSCRLVFGVKDEHIYIFVVYIVYNIIVGLTTQLRSSRHLRRCNAAIIKYTMFQLNCNSR